MCRTTSPESDEGQFEEIRRWADKGKAWAQNMLGGSTNVALRNSPMNCCSKVQVVSSSGAVAVAVAVAARAQGYDINNI